ncbi:PriCT-2 domain-containing protein, partial [Adlercreutzia mucosicola]
MTDREALLDALGSIDPAGLAYQEFVEIGMALKHEGLPFEAWDSWAARDAARYKGTLRRKWDGFSDANAAGAPVTGGTLVQAARD